jgi:hypothetical protein
MFRISLHFSLVLLGLSIATLGTAAPASAQTPSAGQDQPSSIWIESFGEGLPRCQAHRVTPRALLLPARCLVVSSRPEYLLRPSSSARLRLTVRQGSQLILGSLSLLSFRLHPLADLARAREAGILRRDVRSGSGADLALLFVEGEVLENVPILPISLQAPDLTAVSEMQSRDRDRAAERIDLWTRDVDQRRPGTFEARAQTALDWPDDSEAGPVWGAALIHKNRLIGLFTGQTEAWRKGTVESRNGVLLAGAAPWLLELLQPELWQWYEQTQAIPSKNSPATFPGIRLEPIVFRGHDLKEDDPLRIKLVAIDLDGRGVCSGSVISPLHVLTAAHCLKGPDPKGLVIWLQNRSDQRMGGYRVRRVIVHPRYPGYSVDSKVDLNHSQDRGAAENDLALLELSRPVDPEVAPLRFHLSGLDRVREWQIAGVGRQDIPDDSPRGVLQVAAVSPRLSGRPGRLIEIPELRSGAPGALPGDSGGPLLVRFGGSPEWFMKGVVIHSQINESRSGVSLSRALTLEPHSAWLFTILQERIFLSRP